MNVKRLRTDKSATLTRGMVIRMAADAALLAIAMVAAVTFRLLFLIAFEKPAGVEPVFYIQRDFGSLLSPLPTLIGISLIVFWMNGFYNYGKHYTSKYKSAVVFQAVSLSFLIFVAFGYFVSGRLNISRGAIPMAWLFATGLLIGARVWSDVWKGWVVPEREQLLLKHDSSPPLILVVGGAGYIGSSLVPRLLADGFRVRLLDVLLFGTDPIAESLDHPHLELIQGDFRNVVTVYSAMQDVDAVVHLGAIVGDPACNLNEELTIDVNLISTRMIADVAKSAGVHRFVFASTCSVYGASDEILSESSEVQPVALYGNTKLASEQVLIEMASETFKPTILRFATIYGFSGRTRFDLVVNLLTAKARLEGKITVHGGEQWRPFVHVDDAARAIAMVLEARIGIVGNQIFNVGSNEQNYTISQIAQIIQDRVIDAEVEISPDVFDIRNYRVSFNKIEQQLGFRPARTVVDGVQQVLEAIASGEIEDYSDPRYSNAKLLNEEGAVKLDRDLWARELIRNISGAENQ